MNPRPHLHDRFDTELCLIGATSDAALAREIQALLHTLEHASDLALPDVAYTLAHAARGAPVVLSVVASGIPDLCERLRIAQVKLTGGATRIRDKGGLFYFRHQLRPERGVVFLFPGETAVYPEMLRCLCLAFDTCREAFDEADAACIDNKDGFLPSEWLFGGEPTGRSEARPAPGFADSLLCTLAANSALTRLFDSLGVRPDAVLGHSGGEFTALEYAGVFGRLQSPDRIRLLRDGYHLCASLATRTDLPQSVLISLEDPPADLFERIPARWKDRILPAMLNGPRQTVVSAPAESAGEAKDWLRNLGVRTATLGLRRAYHTPGFAPALDPIRTFLRRWIRHPPRIPVYSCLTAGLLPDSPSALLDASVCQWREPVRFSETIERLHADGFRVFLELGPRGNLSTRVPEVLGSRPHVAVAANRIHRPGLNQLHHALAQLAAHGVALDAAALYRHRNVRMLDLRRPTPLRRSRGDRPMPLDPALPEIRAFASHLPLAARETVPADGRSPAIQRTNFGADFPLLTHAEVNSEKPGEAIDLVKTYTTDDYPLIRDHALAAHQVSVGQPRLGGLPTLSAVTCIEIMAEAARRLAPQKRVIQVDDLRGKRIVTFERGESRILIQARRIDWPEPGQTAVRVTLRTLAPGNSFPLPMAEATVFLASLPPERETARPTPLRNPRAVNWTRSDIYPDRLFQGPILQSVNHVFQWGEDGLDYEIAVPPRGEAVRDTRIPLFSVWPLMMDGVISGIGLWRGSEKFNGVLTLPFRARCIRFLASVIPEGARLRAYLRITAVNPRSYVADVLVTDGRGRVALTASGWEELICPVTPALHRLMQRPAETFLTDPLPQALLGDRSTPVRGCMAVHVRRELFEGRQELWLKAVAFALLNRAERDEWLSMRGTASRRIEWLLGRACVKDAIRKHLLEQHGQTWAAADIPIWTDDSGKPHAHGPWQDRNEENIDISIAHTSGLVAAAIAVNGRIGIDLERIGRDLSDDFSRSVFTTEEQDLAAASGEGPTALLRFWCAKEALAKALGTGIRYNPSDLRVRTFDASTGRADLELAGQWLDAFPSLRHRSLPVHSGLLLDSHILATCTIAAALLPPP